MLGMSEMETLAQRSALGGRLLRGYTKFGLFGETELKGLSTAALRWTTIAGGAAGDHTVTGIEADDVLRSVIALDPAHGHDLTPGSTGGTTNALGEDGAGALETAAAEATAMPDCIQDGDGAAQNDLTDEFEIAGADTINNGGGTDTSGQILMVVYEDLTP